MQAINQTHQYAELKPEGDKDMTSLKSLKEIICDLTFHSLPPNPNLLGQRDGGKELDLKSQWGGIA